MKDQNAVNLGRKGARATNKKLTAQQRRKNARKAALARWQKAKRADDKEGE